LLVPSSECGAAAVTKIAIAERSMPANICLDQIKVAVAIDVHGKKVPRKA
jgi:hypothetical protein